MEVVLTVSVTNNNTYYFYRGFETLYRMNQLGLIEHDVITLDNQEAFIAWIDKWNGIIPPSDVNIALGTDGLDHIKSMDPSISLS